MQPLPYRSLPKLKTPAKINWICSPAQPGSVFYSDVVCVELEFYYDGRGIDIDLFINESTKMANAMQDATFVKVQKTTQFSPEQIVVGNAAVGSMTRYTDSPIAWNYYAYNKLEMHCWLNSGRMTAYINGQHVPVPNADSTGFDYGLFAIVNTQQRDIRAGVRVGSGYGYLSATFRNFKLGGIGGCN